MPESLPCHTTQTGPPSQAASAVTSIHPSPMLSVTAAEFAVQLQDCNSAAIGKSRASSSRKQAVMPEVPLACQPLQVPVHLYLPYAHSQCTYAVFSPGFLVSASQYDSYLRFLAASGVPALSYDLPQQRASKALSDIEAAQVWVASCSASCCAWGCLTWSNTGAVQCQFLQVLESVLTWCSSNPELQAALLPCSQGGTPARPLLIGHR